MRDNQLVNVLAVICAIGLLENEFFVDYEALFHLIGAMGTSQLQLQKLRILANTTIRSLYQGAIYHLHEQIRCRLTNPPTDPQQSLPPAPGSGQDLTLQPVVPLPDNEEQSDDLTHIRFSGPVAGWQKWTNEEEKLLALVIHSCPEDSSCDEIYENYVKVCRENNSRPHARHAVRMKISRMNIKKRSLWTSKEIELLREMEKMPEVEDLSLNEKYEWYLAKVKENNLEARTIVAFRRKTQELKIGQMDTN